ncbi:MAG: molybdenum cofactor guanylyltransferase [Bacteroidota bacterium]
MDQNKALTGIILAGGKSRRMGTDKGLVCFSGKPLVQYAIDSLSPFCERILISSNNQGYERFGYEVVNDKYRDVGPMAGIASCLKQSRTEGNLVVSCDMPLLHPVVIKTILENTKENTFVVPTDAQGRAEPLCAFYRMDSLDILLKMITTGSYRMTELFIHAPVRYISPQDYPVKYDNQWFANFNSMEDLVTNCRADQNK